MGDSNTSLPTLGGPLSIQTFQGATDFIKRNSNYFTCGHGNKRSRVWLRRQRFSRCLLVRSRTGKGSLTSRQVPTIIKGNQSMSVTWQPRGIWILVGGQTNRWMLSTATNTRAESGRRYKKETHILLHKSNDQKW